MRLVIVGCVCLVVVACAPVRPSPGAAAPRAGETSETSTATAPAPDIATAVVTGPPSRPVSLAAFVPAVAATEEGGEWLC